MSSILIEVLKETAKVAIPIIVNEFFKDDNKSHRSQKHKHRQPNYNGNKRS